MNKTELITEVAARSGETKKKVGEVLDVLLDQIQESVASGDKITLVGFGIFEKRERAERQGRNPKSRETMTIPATVVPKFSPGKIFKEKVCANKSKQAK